ncbi:GNAT family N-acetyltransferase [Lactobacillaceae bacterium Melli_B4]
MVEDPEDFEEIISSSLRGNRYFQVVNDGDLIGYFCVEPLSIERVEIGLGLKPDLTGQGLGLSFLGMIESFILKQQKYQTFILSVVSFNERAQSRYILK